MSTYIKLTEMDLIVAFILLIYVLFCCMVWAYGRGQQQGHTKGFEQGYKTGKTLIKPSIKREESH